MTSDSWTAERLSAPRLHTLSAEGVRWPAPGLGPPAAREGGSSGPLFESQKSLILSRAETGIPELFFSTHIHRLPLCPFINTWEYKCFYSTIQFSSVAQSCPTLCDPMNRSTPGLPVHHQLPEFTQTHVHHSGSKKKMAF